jgi:3-hydroxyacyl-[acyl-carrier-protein] dehydratase
MTHVLKEFYSILQLTHVDTQIIAGVVLNKDHTIYQGHFPEVPIVPGVCQMQMTKEIISDVLHKNLQLTRADNMKFMAVIRPEINNLLTIKIDYALSGEGLVKINSSIFFEGLVFFKFSGQFKEILS